MLTLIKYVQGLPNPGHCWPSKTVYYVHPGVLSSCGSPVLKARVNDQWIKNGTSGTIDWTEFDEETVECALSYLYVEDYDVRDRTFVGAQIEERNDNDQIGTFRSPPFNSVRC